MISGSSPAGPFSDVQEEAPSDRGLLPLAEYKLGTKEDIRQTIGNNIALQTRQVSLSDELARRLPLEKRHCMVRKERHS